MICFTRNEYFVWVTIDKEWFNQGNNSRKVCHPLEQMTIQPYFCSSSTASNLGSHSVRHSIHSWTKLLLLLLVKNSDHWDCLRSHCYWSKCRYQIYLPVVVTTSANGITWNGEQVYLSLTFSIREAISHPLKLKHRRAYTYVHILVKESNSVKTSVASKKKTPKPFIENKMTR